MIAENVKKVFEENPWFLATCGEEPNVVPVGFKCITEDGKFAVGAVLLETTLENLKANGKIAIAVCSAAVYPPGPAPITIRSAMFSPYVPAGTGVGSPQWIESVDR